MNLGRYDIVDVSLALNREPVVFPGDTAPRVDGPHSFVAGENREFVYELTMSTQSGTHIQGQHYFQRDGKRLEDYPLGRFEGPALVVDCRGASRIDADLLERELPARDLASWRILFHTGYIETLLRRSADRGGRLRAEDIADKPGLTGDGAELLVGRGASFLGIDSVGFEPYPTADHAINRRLGEHDVLLLENLIHLEKVPRIGGWLECFPLPLAGVEGTPCRAIVKIPVAVEPLAGVK